MRACVIDPQTPQRVALYSVLVWMSPDGQRYATLAVREAEMVGADAIAAVCDQIRCAVPALASGPVALVGPELERFRAGAVKTVLDQWRLDYGDSPAVAERKNDGA